MNKRVLVPISRGTEELEAVGIIDILRRAGITVIIAGETEIISCANGVRIMPEKIIDELYNDSLYDAIVIPGGLSGVTNLEINDNFDVLLRNHFDQGKLIAAICAAPIILASKKILTKDSIITSHPSVKNTFVNNNYSEDDVVVDNNIITSRGAGTVIPFALSIIEYLSDKTNADLVAEKIVYKR